MNLINKNLLEKFDAFARNLKSSDRIAVYHDSDPDGTCSAVIVAKAVERLTGKKIAMHIGRIKNERYISTELASRLKQNNINKIITVDISVDEKIEGVLAAQEFADVLVVDHHKIYCDLNNVSKKILMLKPQMLYNDIDPTPYCAAKFSYDLFSRCIDLSDLDWVASVGIIGDVGSKMWPEFLSAVFKKYEFVVKKDFFKSKMGKIAHFISSAEVYDDKNVDVCFDVLFNAKHPKDVLDSVLKKFAKTIEDEINYFVNNAKKLAEFHNDIGLVFYFVKPKYAIKSPLSTIIGFKYPKKTVMVVSKDDDRINVSARRQDKKLAVNDLLEEITFDFKNSNAGGHSASAGAAFPAEYFQEFKRRLIEKLQKHKIKE